MGLPTENEKIENTSVDSTSKKDKENTVQQPPGRPNFSRDSEPRKQKRVLPRSGEPTTALIWAMDAQGKISDILHPIALSHFKKSNIRSLNKGQVKQLDTLKNKVFASLDVFDDVNEDLVKDILDKPKKQYASYNSVFQKNIDEFKTFNKRNPNTNELKIIHASTLITIAEKTQ
jgi:hypothetical protein